VVVYAMKKKRAKKISKTSLEMRNLARHRMPPPSRPFRNKKKNIKKYFCRNKNN
jgi:hypothetical protein